MTPESLQSALDSETHRGLTISCVFGNTSEELKSELIDFWLQNRVLNNREEAEKRASQVVNIVTDANHRIVGVNTIYIGLVKGPDDARFWLYRTFIHPKFRFPALSSRVFRMTVRHLASLSEQPGMPKAMLIVAENPKLRSPAGHRKLLRLGLRLTGKDQRGLDVWRVDF